jgi:hypothetical protein
LSFHLQKGISGLQATTTLCRARSTAGTCLEDQGEDVEVVEDGADVVAGSAGSAGDSAEAVEEVTSLLKILCKVSV